MARYFFDVQDGIHIIDEVGIELPDLEAVQKTAADTASELLKDRDSLTLWSGAEWYVAARDERDKRVLKLTVTATLT